MSFISILILHSGLLNSYQTLRSEWSYKARVKIIDVCPDCADRKWEAKWRATPHDSEKEDKGRQQKER